MGPGSKDNNWSAMKSIPTYLPRYLEIKEAIVWDQTHGLSFEDTLNIWLSHFMKFSEPTVDVSVVSHVTLEWIVILLR